LHRVKASEINDLTSSCMLKIQLDVRSLISESFHAGAMLYFIAGQLLNYMGNKT